MRLHFLLIALTCFNLFSCAKKINGKTHKPTEPSSYTRLPTIAKPEVTKEKKDKDPKDKDDDADDGDDKDEPSKTDLPKIEMIEKSCLTKEQYTKLKNSFDQKIADQGLPLENVIDGKSQADIADLKKVLTVLNQDIKAINEKCPSINISKLKYVRKTLSENFELLGINVEDDALPGRQWVL